MLEFLSQIDRFLHVLFGITWIGLLYYFNFVGAGYLKEATPEGKKTSYKNYNQMLSGTLDGQHYSPFLLVYIFYGT